MSIPAKFVHLRPPFNKNPVYHQRPPASPIHLSSSVLLRSGSVGNVSSAALKNPMGQDMELIEIKFELSGANPIGGSTTFAAYGGSILCELTMGNVKLTNGAIPIWCFGRAENLEGETKNDSLNTNNNGTIFSSYSWRLPRPLFIPAGGAVIPKFTHTGFIPDSVNVRVGYSARTVFVQPKRVYVPWVAKYTSKVFNPISAAGVDASIDLDLVNANPEVLNIQRFVGRTLVLNADGSYSEDQPQSFGSHYLSARIVDSYGRPIVRTYTPFRSIFCALTRSWEMDNCATLDPQSFYIVNLKKDATVVLTEGASGQAFVSMVGWREVAS